MSQRTEIHYTCDICGAHDTGSAQWKDKPIELSTPALGKPWVPSPTQRVALDVCRPCWIEILKAMESRTKTWPVIKKGE